MSDIYLHLAGKKLLISFDYNIHTVEKVKKVPGARWNKNLQRWEAPLAAYNNVVTLLDNLKISKAVMEKIATESEVRKKVVALQKADLKSYQLYDYTPKVNLMAHQKIAFDLHRLLPGSANTSEMGAGKCTVSSTLQLVNGELLTAEKVWDIYATNPIREDDIDGGWWADPKETLHVSSINKDGIIVKRKVKKLFKQKINEKIRKIVLDDGSEISVTKQHKFLIKDSWTNHLEVGDRVCVPKTIPHENGALDETLAELFGWMVGDGSERHKNLNRHTFTQKNDIDRYHFKSLLEKVLEDNDLDAAALEYIPPRASHRAGDITICSASFRELCESKGYVWGKLSAEKQVPSSVMRANSSAVSKFLRGYFDAEASVDSDRNQIEISSASQLLLKQVNVLLRRFGIWLRTRKKRSRATNGLGIWRDYWVGVIGGPSLRKYNEAIGFSIKEKREALAQACEVKANSNVEGIPASPIIREIISKTGLPIRHVVGANTVYARGTQETSRTSLAVIAKKVDDIITGRKELQMQTAIATGGRGSGNNKKWLSLYESLDKDWLRCKQSQMQNLIDQEVHYATIKNIEEIDYDGWVYDLEVEDDHNYVAENILCHNTGSAICAIHWNILTGKTKNALVICPLSVIRGWEEQIEFFSNLSYIAVVGKNKDEKISKLDAERDVYLINYEGVWRDGIFEKLQSMNINMVICDEAHRIKDPGSKQSKAIYQLGDAAEYRIALTGSPVLNSSLDAFGIMRFVDSEIFGDSFYSFRNKYFLNVAPEKSPFAKFVPRTGADQEISDKMYTRAIRYLKEECLDLPDAIHMPDTIVTLSDEQDRAYREMQENLCAEIEGNKQIKISHILTLMLKLNQITSGWIKDPDTGKIHYFKKNPKFEALLTLIEEIGHKKAFILWAYYIADMNLIYNYFSRCTNEKCKIPVNNIPDDTCPSCGTPILYRCSQVMGSTKNRRAEIAKFRFTREERAKMRKGWQDEGKTDKEIRDEIGDPLDDGSEPPQTNIIACQCVAASEGLNLQRATEAIFYSRNYSLKDWMQALARNHRQGQTKTVTYMNLVAKLQNGDDTVDQRIVDSLKRKEDLSKKINKDDLKSIFGLKKSTNVELEQDVKEGEDGNDKEPEERGLF